VVSATNDINGGIFRSTDLGASFTQISGGAGTGLPTGRSFDLASDPTDPSRLFTNAGANGIYRSTDTGLTWTKISDAVMDALISGLWLPVVPAGNAASNIEIAVGTGRICTIGIIKPCAINVYVAIVDYSGQLAGLFRSGDAGNTWTQLDTPTTTESGGATFGIHPGRQGELHLSIAADPTKSTIVYVGGDHQPCFTQSTDCPNPPATPPAFPNSIGANSLSGRLFRVDASQPAGSQAAHLTHSNSLGAAGGGTASNSAPHADSRDMDVAANGVLIEVDDGGIYRRTSPQTNTGDWFSMNGDIQTTEFHAVAWDANADIVVGGAQDIGTPQQQMPSNVRWRSVVLGDGGVVAVDDSSTPGLSTRYSSAGKLRRFQRQVYRGNVFLATNPIPLTVLGGGPALIPQFFTPIELNTVTPTRLVIGGSNGVYESLPPGAQGDTITMIGPAIVANAGGRDAIAYGAAGNADVLYVGSGAQVFIRTAAAPAPLIASVSYPGVRNVEGIEIDPDDPQTAYVVDRDNVFWTTDAGASWANITGNLSTLGPGDLRSIAYGSPAGRLPTDTADSEYGLGVVVGSDTGVFRASGPTFSNWSRFGSGLPAAPVFHLEYAAEDSILLAGLLGRGAWTLDVSTRLTLSKVLMHPDPNHFRRFNLKIDGDTVGADINAGSTGPHRVRPGKHTVSETGGTGTNLSHFYKVIGGDCGANGVVSAAPGESKFCTITNFDNYGGCSIGAKCCEQGVGEQKCKLCSPRPPARPICP
jgi:hypothetical protein